MTLDPSDLPEVRRVRHDVARRELTVKRVERLSASMVRVIAGGDALQGFTSLGFDDHVKLFFVSEAGEQAMRDFTPRPYDAAAGELWIDFFLHDAGPAGTWAAQAAVGQTIVVGGPRGSSIISPRGIDSFLLIGDETALPAIGRFLEELPFGVSANVVIECSDGTEQYPLPGNAANRILWVARRAPEPAQDLINALGAIEFATTRCFAWAALELRSARIVRRYLVEERGFGKHWIKAASYWQRNATGTHTIIDD